MAYLEGAPMSLDVLVIDDEKNIRTTLRMCLEGFGCKVSEASKADGARAALARHHYDLAFLDLRLEECNGLDLLPELLAASPGIDVVIVTAYATVQTAVEAIQRGARDYIPKPFTPAQIRQLVERLANRRALEREVNDLRTQLGQAAPEIAFDTASAKVQSLLAMLDKGAQHDVPVLLQGENGTGKSVFARRIHDQSARAAEPFVVVNCPTLSEELLASELFGHARGAFTGAVKDQPGRVEAAEGGTLFLDEIGEMPPPLQAKLLRFLQDKQFERIGETTTRQADVRIVAATNRDLPSDVRSGRFREDLLYRLNTFELTVPPLRERREDIIPLARRFAAFFARATQRRSLELTGEAEAALLRYDWPGNIRELRNAIERAAILAPGQQLGPELLPERIAGAQGAGVYVGGDFTFDEVEREHMLRVVANHPKVEDAARVLGIDTSTLWRKRKRAE
jgi:NtrC-family two-component system response regulator AlgB